MPALELPGGGITRPKYDRVIANSLEELAAFRPEVPHVWGMVRGQFTRRYWNGLEWKVAGVIGSGPLASAPVASAGNKGSGYYDPVKGPYISMGDTWLLVSDLELLGNDNYDLAFIVNNELMLDINGSVMLAEA